MMIDQIKESYREHKREEPGTIVYLGQDIEDESVLDELVRVTRERKTTKLHLDDFTEDDFVNLYRDILSSQDVLIKVTYDHLLGRAIYNGDVDTEEVRLTIKRDSAKVSIYVPGENKELIEKIMAYGIGISEVTDYGKEPAPNAKIDKGQTPAEKASEENPRTNVTDAQYGTEQKPSSGTSAFTDRHHWEAQRTRAQDKM